MDRSVSHHSYRETSCPGITNRFWPTEPGSCALAFSATRLKRDTDRLRNDDGIPPMRILHLLAPARVGGLERVVQGLAGGLHNRDHSVMVAAVAAGDDELSPFLEPLIRKGLGVREIRVPHRAYLRERGQMVEVCRELRPDVLHTHGYRPDVLARGPAKQLGIVTVTTVHGFTGQGWKNRLYEALQVRAFKKFDAVVSVSEPLR